MLLKKTRSFWALMMVSGLAACASKTGGEVAVNDEGGDRAPAAASTATVRTVQEFLLSSSDTVVDNWLKPLFQKSGVASAKQDAEKSLTIARSMKLVVQASDTSGPNSLAAFAEKSNGRTLKEILAMKAADFRDNPALSQDLKILMLKWKSANIDKCAACSNLPAKEKSAVANITRSLTSGQALKADQVMNFSKALEVTLATRQDAMPATQMQTVVQALIRKDVFKGEKAETSLATVIKMADFFGKETDPEALAKLVNEWDGDGMSGLNEVLATAKTIRESQPQLSRKEALERALRKKGVRDSELPSYMSCLKL